MKGNTAVTKVVYTAGDEDFIVLVENVEALEKWRKDSSVPLADVVDGYKVFTTHKQGAQGIMDTPSKATLEGAFGSAKEDTILEKILREGKVQTSDAKGRESSTNDSIGSMANHR